MSENEIPGWHHRCNGSKLGQTPKNRKEQGGLLCSELDTTGQPKNNQNQKIHTGTMQLTGG